ncbi:hypothetical protein Cst_c16640 [Thermoclostridium stercorarium subsp. stercorarium DSM 8532]|jgi:hypothetical protein|uniref:DUF4309 domain-containing protein n=3 Tax=Thermoclostridium stercorarium TaxID=1510 RepID=L7VT06_THES1|nr:hypothetical protein [Thermoclostridium stercorarium]AGC68648.1 hypothetical protein Cst_c16640 [Thermoclostridium stercorarium subsp. stercorarium DSM 8532]AGI39660.1 hypothetical protein Clst_1605 [Thermoclostridium stercorarium subsp. stercorarium DSM 8532]ANW98988.1 hypothetical protein CSTERTH_08100 [Thermoclostridium stercorarium subsp. thermolacticum DSM 2910]ANX01517.1 hypothetical protein CSTERLE_08000 [Thermoclostridium stercorarium subsp. leptospartum DSM 9219]UZQ84629.1 hypothet
MKKNKTPFIIAAAVLIAVGIAVLVFINQGNGNENIGDKNVSSNADENGDVKDTGETGQNNGNIGERKGYYFEYKGVEIGINDEAAPIIEALGEPMNYFEAPSCAFEGMDKIYSYSGFEFTTYTKDGKDYIASLVFLDDTVTTREGITLNATLDDVIATYGSDYEQSFSKYSYSDGNCVLSFIIENGEVVSVEYSMISEENTEG